MATPGRSVAFSVSAFVAALIFTVGLTSSASRQEAVSGEFDNLAARRVQVTTPLRGSPYQALSQAQISMLRDIPGVEGVAWASRQVIRVDANSVTPETTRLWVLNGDLTVLGIEAEGRAPFATRGALIGGNSPMARAGARRFGHVRLSDTELIVSAVVVRSPAIPDLLETVAILGDGNLPDLSSDGEIVLSVAPGWASYVAPRMATLLAPGREYLVLVRYPPEAIMLRENVLGSVSSLVYVLAGVALVLGAGAMMVGTFFRVLSERRLLGLYRAIGASPTFIVATILTEAAILGGVGSTLGTVTGLGAGALIAILTSSSFAIPWVFVGLSVIVGLITNIAAAVVPAAYTVRETPLSAIRSR